MLRGMMRKVLIQGFLMCSVSLGLWSQNLLLNGGFNKPSAGVSPGTPVSYTSYCYAGNSAAANWTTWVNSCGTDISTELVPSTLPKSSGYMIHVTTTGNANGIVQSGTFGEANTLSSAWVYINSGCVTIGTGDGGDTGVDEATCETGRWFQFSHVPNGVTPANEFIVYSVITAGADFYVKNASVVAAP